MNPADNKDHSGRTRCRPAERPKPSMEAEIPNIKRMCRLLMKSTAGSRDRISLDLLGHGFFSHPD
jgi:hypothetical protein